MVELLRKKTNLEESPVEFLVEFLDELPEVFQNDLMRNLKQNLLTGCQKETFVDLHLIPIIFLI